MLLLLLLFNCTRSDQVAFLLSAGLKSVLCAPVDSCCLALVVVIVVVVVVIVVVIVVVSVVVKLHTF